MIVLQPKPTYSCYIQYAYFKLTKEFSTAISSGESMSIALYNSDADFSGLGGKQLTKEGLSWVFSKGDGRRHISPSPGSDAKIGAHSKTSPAVGSPLENSFLPLLHILQTLT